jgi:hypothetical protein
MAPSGIKVLDHHFPKPIIRVKHLVIEKPAQPKIFMDELEQHINRLWLNVT